MADLDLQSLGMRLGEAITPTPRDAPQVCYGTIDAVNANGTLDVVLYGTTLRGLVATTGCVGAAAGMRCVVLRQGPLATVVGLVANTDLADLSIPGDASIGGSMSVGSTVHLIGTSGQYMNASQECSLTETVASQNNGIILVWSYYENGAQDYDWQFTYVPKNWVAGHSGEGVYTLLLAGSHIGRKYVYVSNTKITGYAANSNSESVGGVTFTNYRFVLRFVYGF